MARDISGCITFKPAPGTAATVAGLSFSAPLVQVKGLTITGGVTLGWDGNAAGGNCDQQRAHDEILSNAVVDGGVYLQGVSHVYIVKTDASGMDAGWQIQACDPSGINGLGAYVNTDHVALVGDTLHDIITNNESGHTEGIHWQDTDFGYVGQSRFINDDQQNISFHVRSGRDRLNDLLLENNVFDAPCSNHHGVPQCGSVGGIGVLSWGCNSGAGATLHNVIVRFNSYQGGDTFDGIYPSGCSTIQSYGNIMDGPPNQNACSNLSGIITYSYNLFTNNGVQCGTGNRVNNPIAAIYTNPYPPAYDYTLKRGARAVDLVPAQLPHPRTDIGGKPRPARSKSDAGANQRDPVLIVLGRSIGAARIGEASADVGAFYGSPRARRAVKLGKRTLDRVTYRLHGQLLWTIADRGVIVGIGTTSPYYATAGGIGVSADSSPVRSWSGTTWINCLRAFRRSYGSVGVYVQPAGGRQGKKLASLVMIRVSYGYDACNVAR